MWKSFLLVFIVNLVHFNYLLSQRSVIVYTGLNLSSSQYTLLNKLSGTDSTGRRGDHYLLPVIGIDLDFKLSDRTTFATGLGVSILGAKNYLNGNIPPGINVDRDLRLNYLRIPIEVKWQVFAGFGLVGGYSFNYCYRKNINFFEGQVGSSELTNIFNDFQHAIHLGVFCNLENMYLTVGYQIGLNHVWDTGEFYEEYRAALDVDAFMIKVGYKFSDE